MPFGHTESLPATPQIAPPGGLSPVLDMGPFGDRWVVTSLERDGCGDRRQEGG